MPPNASDTYVIPKPEKEWPAEVKSKEDIIRRIEETMKPLIGNRTEIQQPIQMRFNELIAGVRADVAVKLYGDDLDQMTAQGQRIAAILRKIPARVTSAWSRPRALPPSTSRSTAWRRRVSAFRCRRSAIPWPRRWAGVRRGWCLKATGACRGGAPARCSARRSGGAGCDPCHAACREGQIARSIPLREVARFSYTQGLNQISRENGKRMVTVQVNVRGRDLGGFVKEAQAKIGAIDLPPGMYIGWGGTFESLQSARLRLMLVVPVCFAAIYGLLWLALGGFARAAIVFSAVPMALAGGVFALLLRGIPFSITAAVGFIALSGVAVLNGLVMMEAIRRHRDDGQSEDEAIVSGAMERVRPVLMTALVASLGFVPMALATGTGAEVQRPLATVVIGG
jgi:cobalt-zinc-cadmium resistance protein CzcA